VTLSLCGPFGVFYGAMMGTWWMGWVMWLWFLVLAGLGYLAYAWFRPRRHVAKEDPLEVARLRLARGEITAEEYEELVRRLKQ
jgi:uncharacterized membrane protein